MQTQNKIYHLKTRRLISVQGEDAKSFLQNVITNDMEKLTGQPMIYTSLLSPQGQILNEFFVSSYNDGYLIDIAGEQVDNLIRRLTFFKLRAKATIAKQEDLAVYAGALVDCGIEDPRWPALGKRAYANEPPTHEQTGNDLDYTDLCISLGIPDGFSSIEAERDVASDANLDLLHAIAFDKGCFIGQEVAARMYHRNLSRKRMMVINGEALQKGQILYQGKIAVGEIRDVSQNGTQGIALLKLTNLQSLPAAGQGLSVESAGNLVATLQNPAYAQF